MSCVWKAGRGLHNFEDNGYTYDNTEGVYNRVQLSWNGKKARLRAGATTKANYMKYKTGNSLPGE
jgi:hypothetical protein